MMGFSEIAASAMQRVGVRAGDSGAAQAESALSKDAQAILSGATKVPRLGQDALTLSPQALAAKIAPPPATLHPEVHGNVLVTYLTVGNGHQKAAEAIAESFHRNYPGVNVSLVDLATVTKVGRWSSKLFYPLIKSGLYPKLYELTNKPISYSSFSGRFARWFTQKTSPDFLNLVRRFNPDAVVSTHLMGARLVGDAMDRGTLPTSIHNFQVVTDEYGHGTYVMRHLDGTFVPSPEVAEELAHKGLDPSSLHVSGMPINPAFAEAPKGDVRRALGFDPQARVLLVQGNLVNQLDPYKSLVSELQAKYPHGVNGKPIEVAVATGNNAELKRELEALAKTTGDNIRLRPFGMLSAPQMRDLMRASDLSLTKPGGLTTAESVASGLPMVLLDVMGGGQETYNAAHFSQLGAGVSTHAFSEAATEAVDLLGDASRLARMRAAAVQLGKPHAADAIAETTAATLELNRLQGPRGD